MPVQPSPPTPHELLIFETTKVQELLLARSAEYVTYREKLTEVDTEMQQLREDLRRKQTELSEHVEKLPGGRSQDG